MFCHDAHFNEPWPSAEICRAAIEEVQRGINALSPAAAVSTWLGAESAHQMLPCLTQGAARCSTAAEAQLCHTAPRLIPARRTVHLIQ